MNREKNLKVESVAPEVETSVKEVFKVARYIQDKSKMEKMVVFLSELLKWNRKINLTGTDDAMALAEKQLYDSCMPIKWEIEKLSQNSTLLDIGSGGGFPAIPLKILRPQLKMHLIESKTKKVNFLKHITRILDLEDIKIHSSRFPFIDSKELIEEKIDIITTKAVKPDLGILTAMNQLIADDGIVLLYRKFTREEKKMVVESKFKVSEEISYLLPKSRTKRTLTILTKLPS
ncbi:MAG: 16S rRNA (guanine(527)-N(7))-methyltransferase RsmG [Candidatus Schekmanbacteria bacterium]|nr:MAG: 16S rRNA (guanine(527)-N(7))-methyltransferase RsmG [Candidatus Schekmanbacteria bacterium]